ncbi:hypothetical protein [Streptomyces sp. NPDC058385]
MRSRPRPSWPRATAAAGLFPPGMFSAFGAFLQRHFVQGIAQSGTKV